MNLIFSLIIRIIIKIPYFKFITETSDHQCRITFKMWFIQKVLNFDENKNAYWPIHHTSLISCPQNILAGIDTNPGFMPGCYIQAIGKIYIGDYTQIGPNVTIISANHNLYDTRKHKPTYVKIGKYCWIGAGAKIMPGVTLGDFTIVGAGAIVTKSFEDGYCVIVGNTAKCIKHLDKSKCIIFRYKTPYNGYIKHTLFDAYRKINLNV